MLIQTVVGDLPEELLSRVVGLEDREDAIVVWIEFRIKRFDETSAAYGLSLAQVGELVRRDTFSSYKDQGPEVTTTLGMMPKAQLHRTLELTDTDTDIAVATVYRLNGEIVHRSAWVIVKQGTEAVGVAASVG